MVRNLRLIRQALSIHGVMGRPYSGPPPSRGVLPGPASYDSHNPFHFEELVGNIEHSVPKQGDGSLDLRISIEDQGGKG